MRAFFLARSADPIPERVLEEMQQQQACDEVGPRRRPAAEGKRVPVAVGTFTVETDAGPNTRSQAGADGVVHAT